MNESGSMKKKHFCKRDLDQDPILAFFHWIVNSIVKPTDISKSNKNDYVFVAHNGFVCDTQFMYQMAHQMFNHTNVQALLHMNRMIELRVQIHTSMRVATIFLRILINSSTYLCVPLSKSFGFQNNLQKGFFPHVLNTKENFNFTCVGLPTRDAFCPNEMGKEELSRFEEYYQVENERLTSAYFETGEEYDL